MAISLDQGGSKSAVWASTIILAFLSNSERYSRAEIVQKGDGSWHIIRRGLLAFKAEMLFISSSGYFTGVYHFLLNL
jgi:hypothetical protein